MRPPGRAPPSWQALLLGLVGLLATSVLDAVTALQDQLAQDLARKLRVVAQLPLESVTVRFHMPPMIADLNNHSYNQCQM